MMINNRKCVCRILTTLLLLLFSVNMARASALDDIYAQVHQQYSVVEAYGMIPHKRTQFDSNSASMTFEDKQYLTEIFRVVDIAMVERVESIHALTKNTEVPKNYNLILTALNQLDPPKKLNKFHHKIIISVKAQRTYLKQWNDSGQQRYFDGKDKLVQKAHRSLIQAYRILMKMYPEENKTNKTAFFDHLCALDFI